MSEQLETAADGVAMATRLPFGRYRLGVTQPGFTRYDAIVEIHSVVPLDYVVTLTPASLQAQVTVRPEDTLIDTRQTRAVNRVGADTASDRTAASRLFADYTPFPGKGAAPWIPPRSNVARLAWINSRA